LQHDGILRGTVTGSGVSLSRDPGDIGPAGLPVPAR
jgi:hypothetical protein